VQAARQSHDACGAVRFALFAGFLIAIGIPGITDSASLCIQRQSIELTFLRCDHSQPPVFINDRHPITRKINRRSGARRWRRPARAGSAATLGKRRRSHDKNKCGDCKHSAHYFFSFKLL
jgi:hypothetical protein